MTTTLYYPNAKARRISVNVEGCSVITCLVEQMPNLLSRKYFIYLKLSPSLHIINVDRLNLL
jgi:hypothetical protein